GRHGRRWRDLWLGLRLGRFAGGLGRLAAGLLLGLLARLLLGLAALALLLFLAAALLFLATALVLGGAEDRGALLDHGSERLDDDLAGADRVVVARDDDVARVGVAVGVDQADQRDLEPLGLANADRLGLQVDHEDGLGQALHVLDAAQVRVELVELGLRRDPLARGQQVDRAALAP